MQSDEELLFRRSTSVAAAHAPGVPNRNVQGCKDYTCWQPWKARPEPRSRQRDFERAKIAFEVERVASINRMGMSKADKRIPVTEKRWRELNELKGAGQTYDDLLKELIQEANRRRLAERVRAVREADEQDLTSLDEL